MSFIYNTIDPPWPATSGTLTMNPSANTVSKRLRIHRSQGDVVDMQPGDTFIAHKDYAYRWRSDEGLTEIAPGTAAYRELNSGLLGWDLNKVSEFVCEPAKEAKEKNVSAIYLLAVVNLATLESSTVAVVAKDVEEAKLGAAIELGLTLEEFRDHEVVVLSSKSLTKQPIKKEDRAE